MAHRALDLVLYIIHHAVPAHHFRRTAFSDAHKLVGAEHQQGDGLVGEFGDRVVEGESVLAGYGAHCLAFAVFPQLAQRCDAPGGNAQRAIGDDRVDINIDYLSKSLAMRAVALRAVEGEAVRRRLLEGDAAVRVDQVLREVLKLSGFDVQDG